jgi:hypothetical protein
VNGLFPLRLLESVGTLPCERVYPLRLQLQAQVHPYSETLQDGSAIIVRGKLFLVHRSPLPSLEGAKMADTSMTRRSRIQHTNSSHLQARPSRRIFFEPHCRRTYTP